MYISNTVVEKFSKIIMLKSAHFVLITCTTKILFRICITMDLQTKLNAYEGRRNRRIVYFKFSHKIIKNVEHAKNAAVIIKRGEKTISRFLLQLPMTRLISHIVDNDLIGSLQQETNRRWYIERLCWWKRPTRCFNNCFCC